MTSTVYVAGNFGEFRIGLGFDGELHVAGSLEWLQIAFDLGENAVVTVDGDLLDFLAMNVLGSVTVYGDLVWSFQCTGNGDLAGLVTIHGLSHRRSGILIEGDLSGKLAIGSVLGPTVGTAGTQFTVLGNVTGEILVDDELGSVIEIYGDYGLTESTLISVGTIAETGAIAVDWDGYDAGDEWVTGAEVVIEDVPGGSVTLTGNSPAWQVYEITECVADMDNNGVVNFDDVNGFVAATVSIENYAAAYPGLGGSALYHGDMDRSGVINFDDLDLFIDCVVAGGCPTSAGECGGERDGGRSPVQMAAALAGGVAPERQALLAEIIADHAARQRTESDWAYWDAVWTVLTD